MSMIGALRPITQEELDELLDDPRRTRRLIGAEGEVSLQKMWHAIHFLLTGSADGGAPPLCDAVMGGTPIGEDVGYGPARYITPGGVRTIAGALAKLTRQELRRRFRAKTLASHQIYPTVWDEPEEDLFEEAMSYFEKMQECYRDAAARECGMLLSLS